MRFLRSTAAITLLALASCGGGPSTPTDLHNAGLDLASAGDFAGAISSYQEALGGADETLALQIRLDLANAMCHTDAAAAADEFMSIVESNADDLTERDYMSVGRQLKDASAFIEAVVVVDAGVKNLGEAPKLLELISQIGKDAAASGDSSVHDALKGLGYIGE